MKKLWKCNVLVLLIVLLFTGIASGQDGKVIKRWVKGTVIATDSKAQPNTIVVNTINWKGQDLTVGAQVPRDAKITINGKPAALKMIAIGDKVSMVYLREPLRLVVQEIEINR